jgi:hypothetical protein
MSIVSFSAGFVAGWVVRSTVDSSRQLALEIVTRARATARRLRRSLVAEQEFLEDFWAETKARIETEEPHGEEADVHDGQSDAARVVEAQ